LIGLKLGGVAYFDIPSGIPSGYKASRGRAALRMNKDPPGMYATM